jgi:general secretion pathway protein G
MREGKRARGGEVKRGGRNPFSPLHLPTSSPLSSSGGWTLIELVITITVLTVLTLGIIPLVKTSVRRQRETRLRETLREMREAIDEFKRDTVGMQCGGAGAVPQVPQAPQIPGAPGQPGQVYIDPRSKVVISDCTIFGVDNPDHYPPDLQTLVDGVNVIPRGVGGILPNPGQQATSGPQATQGPALSTKKKVYLRAVPVDPVTGKEEWCLRSSYDSADDDCSSSPENVFDVRSTSDAEALNGEKYSDW